MCFSKSKTAIGSSDFTLTLLISPCLQDMKYTLKEVDACSIEQRNDKNHLIIHTS